MSGSVLVFPNGTCLTSVANAVTITNGQVADHIDVQGSDAVPADGGTHWTLCGSGVACTGATTAQPGQDQYTAYTFQPGFLGPVLTTSPVCDQSFGTSTDLASCAVGANQQGQERLAVTGPTVSSDNSASFTFVLTWTAVPSASVQLFASRTQLSRQAGRLPGARACIYNPVWVLGTRRCRGVGNGRHGLPAVARAQIERRDQ